MTLLSIRRSILPLTLAAAAWWSHTAAEPTASPPSAGEESAAAGEDHPFAWLEGRWVGQGLGGDIEEVWSPPRGGVMVGMFQHHKGGRPNFYELFTIGREAGGGEWEMRLRHFDADLRAWEDKDGCLVWEPTAVEDGNAGFGPLHYEREGPDRLRVSVELDSGDGGVTEEFVLTRAR